tara:strand:- start:2794 stop:3861 length:1068 start_codon:yes stop_codon:yes gene_type:complete
MKQYGALADKLDIIVCTSTESFGESVVISDKVRAYPTNSNSKLWYVKDVLSTVNRANIHDIDLVTAQDPFETGLSGWLVARKKRAKLQLQIHTDFMSKYFRGESFKNRIRIWIAKWLLPKADSIRVVSERIKRSLSRVVRDMSKVVVLPIFVDIASIKNTKAKIDLHAKYPQFDFVILMASRIEKEKNIELAINAMREIIKSHPKIGLVITGKGALEKELKSKVSRLGLSNNIVFEGWVNDLAPYYKTADVFLNTSDYEGYGRTLISAAAAGCPIITTDVGLVGEIINKDNCLVIPVGDLKALEDSILKLRTDDDLRNDLSRRAQESVLSVQKNKTKYLEKYKESMLAYGKQQAN